MLRFSKENSRRYMRIRYTLLMMLMIAVTSLQAQETGVTADNGWALDVEMQGSLSNSKTPLWLNANKYGISSLNAQNGYVRGIGAYDKKFFNNKL